MSKVCETKFSVMSLSVAVNIVFVFLYSLFSTHAGKYLVVQCQEMDAGCG